MRYSIDVAEAARKIGPHVRLTDLEHSPALSAQTGAEVWLKLEHLQHTGSFKWRGALNRVLAFSTAELGRGIVTASNGNHGIAVCRAGVMRGVRPLVCLREGAAVERIEMIRRNGGEPFFVGGNPLEAEKYARELASRSGQTFISPYNDPWVIAGQGTVGLEIGRQLDGVDAVFVAVGGGGLIAGVATGLREAGSRARVIGCWPRNSPVLYECLKAGRIVEVPEEPTISDSTAGGIEEDSLTLPLGQELIDQGVLVPEATICAALRLIASHERWMVEGAAGVALAGLIASSAEWQGARVVVLLCGRNISADTFARLMIGPLPSLSA